MVSWLWDFGDGSVSTDQHPKHTYASAGIFVVSLITKTENGCQSLPHKEKITINSLPIVDFTLPKVCVGDEMAVFLNRTENEDKSTNGFTYAWNFGDAFGAVPDNGSTQMDGNHKYTRAGNYVVTLTATNVNGCSYTRSKPFTVNGSQITPVFEVLNKDQLCSNNKIMVKNSSTINSIDGPCS